MIALALPSLPSWSWKTGLALLLLSSRFASALPQEVVFKPGGDKGAVASESKECTRIGIDLIAQGVRFPFSHTFY